MGPIKLQATRVTYRLDFNALEYPQFTFEFNDLSFRMGGRKI